MQQAPFNCRLAPTPSGYLHVGNAFNFVLAWMLTRQAGGSLRLRIDDADQDKEHRPFVDDIFRSLEWLGIDWDIGPTGPDDFFRNWSQRLRYQRYQEVLDSLRSAGQLFGCTCTRKEIRAVSDTLEYPGTCATLGRSLSAPNTAWRWVQANTAIPYPVLRQKNAAPAYMIASVVDDVDHGITHIVRGADLEPASATQQVLAAQLPQLLPFTTVQIHHHPLLVDAEGQKLSKSAGSATLVQLQQRGENPGSIHELVREYVEGFRWPGV